MTALTACLIASQTGEAPPAPSELAPTFNELMIQFLLLGSLGLVALGILLARGYLGPRAFKGVPPRQPALSTPDPFVALVVFFAGQVLIAAILPDLLAGTEEPHRSLRLLWIGQTLAFAPLAGLLGFWAWQRRDRGDPLGLVPRRPLHALAAGCISVVLLTPIAMGLATGLVLLAMPFGYEPPLVGHRLLPVLLEAGPEEQLALIGAVCLLVPFFEEIFFRGIIQSLMMSLIPIQGDTARRWTTIILAAAVFALMHYSAVPWPNLFALFVVGAGFGWLYERDRNLLVPIVAHAGFNSLNVALTLLMASPPPG